MGSAIRKTQHRSAWTLGNPGGLARALGIALLILASGTAVAPAGQQSSSPFQQPRSPSNPFGQRPESPFGDPDQTPVFAARQLRALNAERQKALISDTDKLLKLARELNAEIEAHDNQDLTPPQLRKIADIEKLAHEVKQKMVLSIAPALPVPDRRNQQPDMFP